LGIRRGIRETHRCNESESLSTSGAFYSQLRDRENSRYQSLFLPLQHNTDRELYCEYRLGIRCGIRVPRRCRKLFLLLQSLSCLTECFQGLKGHS
jgi:hypothetical protein